ncbi:galactokinase [Pedobacter sp. SYSU D00535]|uniref:galactokinase n=1 Tax=Pedobacter sp. SYSU D00535 TaxID=2810308 RepID=UPI001A970A33|nr:galactokinase [Pedobacter sp. SYSU D00535]
MGKLEKIADKFRQLHNSEPVLVRAPGRINLIGEHTDYNLGSVLPGAIDKCIYMAIGTRSDNQINVYAADYSDHIVTVVDPLEKAWKLWPNYVLGVINEVKKLGVQVPGLNIVLGGDIPLAAGLSSSAAITVATTVSLNYVLDLGFSKLEMAQIAQKAEHNFVGVQCGLMDQYASLFGKKGHVIKLDCNTNQHEYIPFETTEVKVVLFDTGVKHHLVSSAYNERREQCQRGVELVKAHHPEIIGLPDITEEMLYKYVKPESELLFRRCLYVVQEIERLKGACEDLVKNDFESLGGKMFETHAGLKDMYEVSCEECDFLVDTVKASMNVLGARMMGAGFGGCTINLIYSDAVDKVTESVKQAYKEKFGKDLKVYLTSIEDGAEVLK